MANDFSAQMQTFILKTKGKFKLTNREIILAVAASLIDKSPVGDPSLWANPKPPKGYVPGRFKANWVGSFGEINYTTTEETDPTGELSLVNINAAIPNDPTGIFYITNSLPYAQILEDGSHSKQVPPQGMVGLTVIEYDALAAGAILQVKAL